MKKEYLYTPGPTAVPPEALSEMGKPMFHHRTARYRELFKEVTGGLKYVLQTQNDVLVFSSSGTGAMEASVVNLLSSGDKAITVNGGKFGERFGQICRAYGVDVDEIMIEWGTAVEPAEISKRLDGSVKAVYLTLCETSTGVVTDIETIAEIVGKTEAALVVDTISGLLCDEIKVDEWGVDVAVGGSQKGLMIPPGVAFVSVSPKAWKLVEKSTIPKFYFSFLKAKKSLETFDNPFTPPVSLMRALRETLSIIRNEGRENLSKLYAKLSKAVRAGIEAIGLELYSKSPSNSVTAVKVPEGVDGAKFLKTLKEECGVTFAGGQEKLKGKIFRIATMGYMNEFDILTALSALEFTLKKMGYNFTPGNGVKTAQSILMGDGL